jgi:DNA-binding NarL/FixJ family response regulator
MGVPKENGKNGKPRLRVLIADDDPLARRALRDALQEAGCAVAADATDGQEAVELALHYRPDVVLMDVGLPRIDGIAAMRQILVQAPEVRVVMLSRTNDEDAGLLALGAGASGYLSKDIDLTSLPRAMRGVIEGEAAVSRALTMRLIERLRTLPRETRGMRPVKSPLTPREWEVLDLMTAGCSTHEIADELVLSPETVYSHIKNLLRKLGVHSRAEAIELAQGLRSAGLIRRKGTRPSDPANIVPPELTERRPSEVAVAASARSRATARVRGDG